MVECSGLENGRARKGSVSSNLTLSAMLLRSCPPEACPCLAGRQAPSAEISLCQSFMPLNNITNNLILELHIPDFDKARKFYTIFGFRELSYDPTSGGGSDLGYMVLERGDAIGRTIINFYGDKDKVSQHARFADFPANTPRGYAVEITVPVADIEKLWNDVEKKLDSSTIAQPLILKRWDKKDFRVVDPFGFYVRFTELVNWGQ